MPGRGSHGVDTSLDDVQVMGLWNFTLQADTPLFWLRTGLLDRYLLTFRLHTHSPATGGLMFHAEADGPGTDGVSFWMERRLGKDGEPGTKRYLMAGDGMDTKPVVTRKFPDAAGEDIEDVEVLVQGYQACVLLQNRRVQIRCRTKTARGSIAFFNSTQAAEEGGPDDFHFSGVRVTALRRGPLEVDGMLGRRERALLEPPQQEDQEDVDADDAMLGADSTKVGGHTASFASTAIPDSPAMSQFTRTMGTTLYKTASPKGFRKTAPGGKQSQRSSSSATRWSGENLAATQPRLRHNVSDSALRSSGVALCGLSPASKMRGSSGQWVPLALNPAASQQQFLRDAAKGKKPVRNPSNACQDFIPM